VSVDFRFPVRQAKNVSHIQNIQKRLSRAQFIDKGLAAASPQRGEMSIEQQFFQIFRAP
jgi:hypothetical protein